MTAPGVDVAHAAVPGRVRLRVARLRDDAAAARIVEAKLAGLRGVERAWVRPRTGSVLVEADPALPLRDLVGLVGSVVATLGPASEGVEPEREPAALGAPGTLYWAQPAEQVIRALDTDPTRGLTDRNAALRLQEHGPNEPLLRAPRSRLAIVAGQLGSLPMVLLGGSALASVLTGGLFDAIAIGGAMVLNAALGGTLEAATEQAIHSLQNVPRPDAEVLREGREQHVPASCVVPGDVLLLRPGTVVAADARLVRARGLELGEGALTGESEPVAKDASAVLDPSTPLADRFNMVFAGTLVTGGSGRAVVTATGGRCERGRIDLLAAEARAPATPLERQLARSGRQLVWVSSALCVGAAGVGLLRGLGWRPAMQTAIALAVAAIPEGLPTVATTTLAFGVRRLRKDGVLVRTLPALEALGSVQVLCLDKTGTLTQNRMSLATISSGEPGTSSFAPSAEAHARRVLETCALCSEHGLADSDLGAASGTERALLDAATAAGVDLGALREQLPIRRLEYREATRPYMRSFHGAGPTTVVAVKGQPEAVLALCREHVWNGAVVPLDPSQRTRILRENARLAGRGLRVLGVARRDANPDDEPPVWLGLVGLADPVRDGLRPLVARLREAGIAVLMVTGDQRETATAIAETLGLPGDGPLRLVDAGDPAQLEAALRAEDDLHVVCRATPADKLALVRALQARGRVVAMTGDGINDGPALRAADVGIAMGDGAQRFVLSLGDMVLCDGDLAGLLHAIERGRVVYDNIRRPLRFLVSTNGSELFATLGGIALFGDAPLHAMQLLWLNLLTDVIPALALSLEPAEPDVMTRPPRDSHRALLDRAALAPTLRESALLGGAALGAYGLASAVWGRGARARSVAFHGLAIGQLLHAWTCRAPAARDAERNPWLPAALGATLGLQLTAGVLPVLRGALGVVPLGVPGAILAAAAAGVPLWWTARRTPGAAR